MKEDVLVIGNGFDLHHGRKTKYSDFLEFLESFNDEKSKYIEQSVPDHVISYIEENGNNDLIMYFQEVKYIYGESWVDFEAILKMISVALSEEMARVKIYYSEKGVILKNTPEELKDIGQIKGRLSFSKNFKFLYSRDRYFLVFDKKFFHPLRGLDRQKIVEELEKYFLKMKRCFILYLIYFEEYYRAEMILYKQIRDIDPGEVYSFNYTDTAKIYGFDENRIQYLHGSVNKDNIVMGYDDFLDEKDEFTFLNKYVQRILYETDWNNIRSENTFMHGPFYHFFGHSLHKSDKELLVQIFESAEKCIIYYLDELDKASKLYNLIDVLTKDKVKTFFREKKICFEKIQFEKCDENLNKWSSC